MPRGVKRRTKEPGVVPVKVPKRTGRPPGRRNTSTLMKEAAVKKIVGQAHDYLVHEVVAILETVCQKAREGDMQAAKLVLDRVLPVQRDGGAPKEAPHIEINIIGGSPEPPRVNGSTYDAEIDQKGREAHRSEPEAANG